MTYSFFPAREERLELSFQYLYVLLLLIFSCLHSMINAFFITNCPDFVPGK